MGNAPSSSNKNTKSKLSLINHIDKIAAKYILTPNFSDMKNLTNEKYCNKLVILTADIISKNVSDKDLVYLKQRLQKGNIINEMANESVLHIRKDKIGELDVKQSTQKKRMCIGIARFYIKIAHVFSAIVTTVRPQFENLDRSGSGIMDSSNLDNYRYYDDYHYHGDSKYLNPKIPKKQYYYDGGNSKKSKTNTLCNNRLSSLKIKKSNLDDENKVIIQPNFCSDKQKKNLSRELGIPELEKLYYDKYDFTTGKFTSMKDETKKQYMKDLELFYKTFTGNKDMPKDIKKFSDIALRKYNRHPSCKLSNSKSQVKITGSLNDQLISNYANHVSSMTKNMDSKEDELLEVIKKLFSLYQDPKTKLKHYIINPNLNNKLLDDIVKNTRNIIVNLYTQCENDFSTGVGIYEQLIEKKMKDTTQSQIETIREKKQEILSQNFNQD